MVRTSDFEIPCSIFHILSRSRRLLNIEQGTLNDEQPVTLMNIRTQLQYLPRPFWVLVGATFVNRFGVFVVPFLALFITRNGNTAAQAGYAVAAYSVGSFGAAWLGGWLADLAVQRFAVNLAWSLGPATAGLLAEHASFFWLFVVDAVTSVIFGLIAWMCLPRGRRTEASQAGWSHAWASIRQNKPFLALFGACLCTAWIFRQTNTTFPLHFERNHLPLDWCGYVLALNGVMICLFEVPLAALLRSWPVRGVLALGYILMGASFLVFLGSAALTAFVLMMVIFTVGEMSAFSRQQAYAAEMAPEEMRGRYVGFLSFAWSIGNTASSALGMPLYDRHPDLLWGINAALGVLAAVLILSRRGLR